MNIFVSAVSDSVFEFIRQNGLGCEVMAYASSNDLDNFKEVHPTVTEKIRGISKLSMHGSFDGVTYATNDRLIVEVTRKRFLQCIDAAAFHGINRLVFHSAYRSFFGFNNRLSSYFIEASVKFWQGIDGCIPDGMTVYIENVDDEDPHVFAQIIDGIASPKIRCCLDIGHACAYSSVPLNIWVKELGNRIGHVHINDNDGKRDLHLPLGEGTLPLAEAIHCIKEHVGEHIPFVLECDAAKSVAWLKRNNLL